MAAGVRQFPLALQTCAGVTTPSVHDCDAPQRVPAGALPFGTQTAPPVAHEIVPVGLQASPVEQVPPAAQATQLPPLHTRFVPQLVPSAAVPIAWQV
jgi:hypothetical protein